MNSSAFASLRRLFDLGARRVGLAVGDVLPDRLVEEDRLLLDVADLVAERLQGVGPQVLAVDPDRALGGIVEARDEVDQRRLALAGRADDRAHLAGRDFEVDVLEDELVRLITKSDVVEGDVAGEARRGLRVRRLREEGITVQDLLDAVHADGRLGGRVRHLREVLHRLEHLAEVEEEDDQRARRHLVPEDEARAVPEDEGGADRRHDVHHGREERLDAPRLQSRIDRLLAPLGELLLLDVALGEGLDHPDGAERLLDRRDDLALLDADLFRRLLDEVRETLDEEKQEGRHGHRDERELPVDVEHHDEHADDREDVDGDRQDRAREEGLDVVDVVGDRREDVSELVVVVVGERETLEMVVDLPPQIVREVLADARRQVRVEVRGDGVDERDHDRRDGGHRDRARPCARPSTSWNAERKCGSG